MKYYFKENFRLLYADGALYDSHNNPVYTYRNQTLFFPQIDLFRYGEKVGHVKKNFTFFLRQYDIFVKERTVDTLNQQFTLFRQELQLERLGWTIKGDFLALSYQIYDRNGNMICEVDQELFHLTRQYYVNILDESQELLIILVVLAINQYDKDLSASSSAAHHSHSNH
ncbi:MAG: hypothetical protein IKD99_00705 [Erysipelotrichaceae bacterium]|nr:hypothetical protein [Erysipelotrichaceae bacterium]